MLLKIEFRSKRMCQGTFWCLRRSLATSSLYATVRILAERFYILGKSAFLIYNKKPEIPHPSGVISPVSIIHELLTSSFYKQSIKLELSKFQWVKFYSRSHCRCQCYALKVLTFYCCWFYFNNCIDKRLEVVR